MISTHILDTTKGAPAQGVTVVLEKQEQDNWIIIGTDKTNVDGRIVYNCAKEPGIYKLTFKTNEYFKNEEHFFMNTPIIFKVQNTERKYHVPLLLNPYGYSTYRGS
jgi:5-hydroxyisourate hydrolase